jgi:methionyl-tRNA formyltransferase
MGTPDIAATCLKRLLEDGHNVVAVYTQPDRPKGRGMKMVYSPVKEVALAANLPVHQPEHFRDPEVGEELKRDAPDAIAVVAYGRILPQAVLNIPEKGCVNIHASLLPAYRGSAPYQWAVLDGQKETGVTAQYMALQMDAGDIIDVAKTPIYPDETAGELLDRLAMLGAELLSQTMGKLETGTAQRTPQDETKVTYAPMLDKTLCPIDWTKTAQQVHDHVRGLHPWPVATAEIGGTRFKIHSTAIVEGSGEPGTLLKMTKTGLQVACGEGAVEIRQLQAEGGKRMAAPDYFRGHPLEGF